MMKEAIGILDMGTEAFSILDPLMKEFRHERFVYFSDLFHLPYSARTDQDVTEIVRNNTGRLLEENLKLLIVASDVISEKMGSYFASLPVPVLNIVDVLMEYVTENYEQKNLVLLAKNSILEANIYQKNFKYNRLYNIASDELEAMINAKMIKTAKSFYTTREIMKSTIKKDIDLIITSSPFLITLKTEMAEYLKFGEITDVGKIFVQKIRDEVFDLSEKGTGELLVLSNVPKKQFKNLVYWSDLPYKYQNLLDEKKPFQIFQRGKKEKKNE